MRSCIKRIKNKVGATSSIGVPGAVKKKQAAHKEESLQQRPGIIGLTNDDNNDIDTDFIPVQSEKDKRKTNYISDLRFRYLQ